MARPRDDNVRDRVVLETFAQIADRGVDGMSMRTLAAATGVSVGTITYHFTTKRHLLLEAIAYGYQRRPAGFQQDDPVASLHALLRRYDLRAPTRRTWWRFWLAVVAYAQQDREVRALLAQQHRSAVLRFRELLAAGVGDGSLAVDDLDRRAEQLVAHAHGIAVSQLADPSRGASVRAGLAALVEPMLADNRADVG